MDFHHSEDRRMLADMFGRLAADRYPIDARNRAAYSQTGFSADLWRQMGELGVTAALFDGEAGGFGGTGFDIMVVFEIVGRHLLVEPLLGTLIVGHVLGRTGSHAAALGRLVSGTAIAALAAEEAESRYDLSAISTTAAPAGTGWRLNGSKTVVAHAEAADVFLVTARSEGETAPALFLVPADAAGIVIRGYGNIDGGRSGEVRFDNVMLGVDARVAAAHEGLALLATAVDAGALALCAEAVGIMDCLREMTVDYLRTRRQFGVAIGSFQALQHRMGVVLIEIEQARSSIINAAAAYPKDAAERGKAVAAAKYTIGHVGKLVAEEAIQLHGGIGMTWELPLSHYAKRLIMIDHQLGDEDHQLDRYIAAQHIFHQELQEREAGPLARGRVQA